MEPTKVASKWQAMVEFIVHHNLLDLVRVPPNVLETLLRLGKATVELQIGVELKSKDEEQVSGLKDDFTNFYKDSKSYECMVQDTHR